MFGWCLSRALGRRESSKWEGGGEWARWSLSLKPQVNGRLEGSEVGEMGRSSKVFFAGSEMETIWAFGILGRRKWWLWVGWWQWRWWQVAIFRCFEDTGVNLGGDWMWSLKNIEEVTPSYKDEQLGECSFFFIEMSTPSKTRFWKGFW